MNSQKNLLLILLLVLSIGSLTNAIVLPVLFCSDEVGKTITFLRKAYAGKLQKVLHVGPDSCRTIDKLSKEGGTEAWGIEPYDLDWGGDDTNVSGNCKTLIYRGIVRVADIKFPLPYKSNSFSLVIVSDALDYLSIKYLNKTLPDLARLSIGGGLVVFSGNPGQQRLEVLEVTKLKSKVFNQIKSMVFLKLFNNLLNLICI